MRTAAQVMTRDPAVVGPDDTFEHCAETMRWLDVRHLVVVNATDKLAGMVSDSAVFEHGRFDDEGRWVPARPDLEQARIAKAVQPADALVPDVPLTEAVRSLLDLGTDVVVFVEDDREKIPVGILTEWDVLRLATSELPMDLRVADVMATALVTADTDTGLNEVRDAMEEYGIRHVPVRRNSELLGVISARDLIWASASVAAGGTVEQLLDPKRPLRTTTARASLAQAAEQMAEHKIGCLPVLAEDGSLEGIVTARDVLKALIGALG